MEAALHQVEGGDGGRQPAGGGSGQEGRQQPLEQLLEDHVVVLQPGLEPDGREPGGEQLLPGQTGRAHVYYTTPTQFIVHFIRELKVEITNW